MRHAGVRVKEGSLEIEPQLYEVITARVAPGTGVTAASFWKALETVVAEFGERNRQLLEERQHFQELIDDWHRQWQGKIHDDHAYKQFLYEIGYLVEEGGEFTITTEGVDQEIATVAGPQLVVPVNNARYALNAVNGRWGSLYDALYGSDVIPFADSTAPAAGYDPARGREVMTHGARFLDTAVPLATGSHADVREYRVNRGDRGDALKFEARLASGETTQLAHPDKFVGYTESGRLTGLLLVNNGLHLEIQLDPDHPVGRDHPAGVKDILLESALTTICDCEDSVAAVDGEDKALTYSNWLGLVTGTLTASFNKHGATVQRSLNPDREYVSVHGGTIILPGRSCMLIRNVGHLMTTGAVLYEGQEIPEGILDTCVTAYVALNELHGHVRYGNSRYNSVYIVKPKMHGPDEVAFTCDLFTRVEQLLGLPERCLKIGIMDEERRTSLNLKECIRKAKDRIIFINTGFLDRTGDEIHTSMEAGPMVPKNTMKEQPWIHAYEERNVAIGLAAGFSGKAQIGKGMWAKPDKMAEMVAEKTGHPLSGANCAWVPSPTAATLHAMHYHQVDVFARQQELVESGTEWRLEDLLLLPLQKESLPSEDIEQELDNNIQSILGYVVRWVEEGVGCSKVPDIYNVGLMEDRATLRISSQHLANWLRHNICSREQVMESMQRMAAVVDRQNHDDPDYRAMATDLENSMAFQAACALIFQGQEQPNGYTEPLLHHYRQLAKQRT